MKLRDLLNENIIQVKVDDLDIVKHGSNRGILQVPNAFGRDPDYGFSNNQGGKKSLEKWKKDIKKNFGIDTVKLNVLHGKVIIDNNKYKKAQQDYIHKKGQALRKGGWPLD